MSEGYAAVRERLDRFEKRLDTLDSSLQLVVTSIAVLTKAVDVNHHNLKGTFSSQLQLIEANQAKTAEIEAILNGKDKDPGMKGDLSTLKREVRDHVISDTRFFGIIAVFLLGILGTSIAAAWAPRASADKQVQEREASNDRKI